LRHSYTSLPCIGRVFEEIPLSPALRRRACLFSMTILACRNSVARMKT
jgi:hypothetical protein